MLEVLTIPTYIILGIASFFAGLLNALAGGGTFFTLPALFYVGLPPVSANATNASVLLPGYLGTVFGLRNSLDSINKRQLAILMSIVVVGAIIGSYALINTSDKLFRELAPFLILLATFLFISGPRITKFNESASNNSFLERVGVFAVSGYGGYFNGGLGIALMAIFSMSGNQNLKQMLALKSLFSLLLTSISVIAFSLAELIHWPLALGMMFFSVLGGYSGSYIARKVSSQKLNILIVFVGLSVSVLLFIN